MNELYENGVAKRIQLNGLNEEEHREIIFWLSFDKALGRNDVWKGKFAKYNSKLKSEEDFVIKKLKQNYFKAKGD